MPASGNARGCRFHCPRASTRVLAAGTKGAGGVAAPSPHRTGTYGFHHIRLLARPRSRLVAFVLIFAPLLSLLGGDLLVAVEVQQLEVR